MKDDIFHTRLPKGSAGGFIYPGPFSHMPMGYSKNQKAAKDFLRWVSSKDIFEQWFTSQQGFTLGPAAIWEEHAVWDIDPVMKPFKTLAHVGRMTGYAGPPGRPAAETVTKYIIVDMYAKVIQGMPAEDAVKWAQGELVKIYG
jgi:multiple sugar transport system substrate-binding protein